VIGGLIEDPAAVSPAVQGAEVVIHLAAKVQPASRELDELYRVNVSGTSNVYAAAVESGCRLFVYMSSAGIYGPPRGPEPFKESDDARPTTAYQRTKWQAEEAVRRSDPKGTTLNIFRPSGIYGAGSRLEIPRYRKIMRRRWSIELAGGVIVHPTHVGDVVEAILAVLDQPAPHGTTFNIGGERPILLQDFEALVAEALGVPRRRVVLPAGLSGPAAGVAASVLSWTGRPNSLLRGMSRGRLFSSAVDDRPFRQRYPGVPVRPLSSGLREHIDWARTQRLL
jgi:nucleoside-diphosphate-sugar epimerase